MGIVRFISFYLCVCGSVCDLLLHFCAMKRRLDNVINIFHAREVVDVGNIN